MMDVHANDKDIPAGKVLLCEYRDLPPDAPRAIPVVLETGLGKFGRHVSLEAIPAGWALAGAVSRWDNGCFRVSTVIDNAIHGRRFKTLDEAREIFTKWTTQEA